jgi:hypothetical protein
LGFELAAVRVAQWAGVAVEDGGGDGGVDGGVQALPGGTLSAHAVEEAVGVQQPESERRGGGPGQQGPSSGVQEDPVVGQKLMALRSEQQRRGGLAGAFGSQRESGVIVVDGGAGVHDGPPIGFKLSPDEFAGDAGGGQAQAEGPSGGEGEPGAAGVGLVGDLLSWIDRTDGVVSGVEGVASKLDDPVRPGVEAVLCGGEAVGIDVTVEYGATGVVR